MKNLKHFVLCSLVFTLLICALTLAVNAETVSVLNSDGSVRIDYDTDTKAMHIVNVNGAKIEFVPVTQNGDRTLQNFMDTYKTEVKSVTIDYFTRLNQYTQNTFFYGYTALEIVNIASGQRLRFRSTGMFEGCSALTTVWVGDESNKKDGTADLTGVLNNAASDSAVNNIFIARLFNGCSSLKKVILPDGSTYNQLPATTFEGCTALTEVTIPENFLVIADDAFADCPEELVINATEGSVAYAFAEEKGLLPSLWAQKPDASKAVKIDYLQDWDGSQTVETNIKYEMFKKTIDGTDSYTLYLYIDESVTEGAYANNKIITSPVADTAIVTRSKDHPFASTSNALGTTSLNKIVIGDGIEGVDREAFAYLQAVTTIELPESFKAINGSAFRLMNALSTVYIRGNAPQAGVIDLSGVEYIDFSNHNTFNGMSSAEKYIFNPNVEVKVDESDYLRYAFYNNTALKTLDLSNMDIGGIGAYTFQNCTSLEEIYLPASVSALKSDSSANGSFKNTPALKAIYAPVGSYMHKYAVTIGKETTHTTEIENAKGAYASFTFYPELGRVEIVSYSASTDLYGSQGATEYIGIYGDLVREIVFPARFQKIRPEGMFAGLKNLESVCFAENERIYEKSGNMFANCSKLTTVYFGDAADMVEGVADFSKMNASNPKDDRFSVFLNGLFLNCSSIKKVVLPAFKSLDASDADAKYNPVISATTFAGCTSLRSIELNGNITAIADGAFESCTALKEIVMNAPVSLIGVGTFAGATKGTVIYCNSPEDAATVNAVLEGAEEISSSNVFAFYKAGMSILGYQVREQISSTANNGLRTVFAFDTPTAPEGFTLLEFGSIVAVADNYDSFTENLGYSSDSGSMLWYDEASGSFKTPQANIVKTAIFVNGAYSREAGIKYKETENGASFNVTVINFDGADQMCAEIVNSAYEIWVKDGTYYVIFTREEAVGYESLSLYKQTLGMLGAGVIELRKDTEYPVWNTLKACAGEAITTDNSAVEGFLLADPLSSGKYIAVYATDSADEQNISSLGIDSAVSVSSQIFGTNVVYALPALDAYWAEHIDEKLASLPEGRSFIIYTDTHYVSGGTQNTRKLPALISYVRNKTGIETVINMGDPYQKEFTKEGAEKVYREALEKDFYNVYGEDGLFVVGNHEANITAFNKLVEEANENGTEAPADYTVLLPDTVLYDASIKHIENKEGIKFDEDMLAIADQLTYADIGGEFTAEQMKNEFIAWVKQHYYYDDTENGIRYIVYNSGNCSLVERYVLRLTYAKIIPTQIRFIANALATVPEDDNGKDYDVVLLGHMLGSNEDNNETYTELYKLLSAFKAGSSYTLTYTAPNANAKAVCGFDGSYTVDFTDNGYNGTVFTMSGHWHRDLSYIYQTVAGNYMSNLPYKSYNYVSDDAVFYIGINNDNYSDKPDGTESEERDPVMTKGTASENCFSIITITPEGNIELTRIGAGVDRSFIYN